MSKQNGNGDVVGFTFQEIPLEEALNVVLAGDGNYAEVKQMLLEKLPNLEAGKAFAFGLPNGKEVHESQRRGLCMGLNTTLKRAKIFWRVTYSSSRKLFICVPKTAPRTYNKKDSPEVVGYSKSKYGELDVEILRLWKQGHSVSTIQKETGADLGRVNYICYKQNPRKTIPPKPLPTSDGHLLNGGEAHIEMKKIMDVVSRRFGIQPEALAKRSIVGNGKAIRKAICVVATQRNIPAKTIAAFVGITDDGVKFNAKANTGFGKDEISELKTALGR